MVERWNFIKRLSPLLLVLVIVVLVWLCSQPDKNFDISSKLVDSLNTVLQHKDFEISLANDKIDSLKSAIEKRDITIDKLKHEAKVIYIVRDRTADELKQFFTTYKSDSIYIQSR